ncbi:AAA family ATPase [Pseudochryseolinea flava]|uniref:Poly(A) polymerase n=1 Tax=Pseudochryseolinea flava TaxID=2059302 RepID=A0A364Y8V6_9BACT|nr:AAA family ATPase [Pseudochryseolinea flava]RAW03521.1 poly(A) polymerase [Pseudochryseolinea flava]
MNWVLIKDKSWQSLERNFEWVADMSGVRQDPRHHAEGDVAVHTQMVLDALQNSVEFEALSESAKEILWTAALLHDVEKRSTTVLEFDGSITSKGHAKKGEYTTRQILYELGAPVQMREQIAALVRHHGLPLWVMEKRDPQKAVIESSLRGGSTQLALLAKADVLGRTCNDQQDLLERIDFFEALCREQQCWFTPRYFETGLARFDYFRKDDSSVDYIPFDDYKNDVIMLSGLPGMGKDFFITRNYPGMTVISLDEIRRKNKIKPDDAAGNGWVIQQAKEHARILLRRSEPFIFNATNITKQMRSIWIDLFTTYKARVKLLYMEVPYQQWLQQNRDRDHPVPEKVIQRMLQKLEVPLSYEAQTVEWIF